MKIIKNEILLVKRRDNHEWALPAGGLKIDEDMLNCIRRETYEETGLEIGIVNLIGVSSEPSNETVTYPNGDIVQNMALVFYTQEFKGKLRLTTEETINANFFEPKSMPRIISNEVISLDFLDSFKRFGQITVK